MSSGSLLQINAGLVLTCLAGLALSYYAYIVETSKERDESYEAMCDISERLSCSKVFMSEFGKGFGIISENSVLHVPNSVYGLVFYSILATISISNSLCGASAVIALGILSNIGSVYLAYLLYLLKAICIVCVTTYAVNVIVLALGVKKYRAIARRNWELKKKLH